MRNGARVAAAGMGLQLQVMRRDLGDVMDLLTAPLFAVIFVAIVRSAGRDDLLATALLAPVLIALWSKALFTAGEIIDRDRWAGTLEPALATPARLPVVVVGRVAATVAVGLVAFVEIRIVGALLGIPLTVHHPLVFALAVLGTALGTAATGVAMAAVFVLARSARVFQNSLSYPFYVLGGVLVPVALLPGWVQPLARGFYLSWASDLLRDALAPEAVIAPWSRLGVVLGLSLLTFAAGWLLLKVVLRRVRTSGALSWA